MWRRTARLPLHGGHCPPWLYERMRDMAGALAEAVVTEFGPEELVARVADPGWFQAFGALLGFDWHSSGLTTVVTAALKEGIGRRGRALGVFVAGGKGRASRETPREIEAVGEREGLPQMAQRLVTWSRLVAKVDNAAVQDGYQLYHHAFFFTAQGQWAVVQQGMQSDGGPWARRYHWWSETVQDPVSEPHRGIVGDQAAGPVLDLTAHGSSAARQATTALAREVPVSELTRALAAVARQEPEWVLPRGHAIPGQAHWDRLLYRLYDRPPRDFADLLLREGVGPKTLRGLVMVAEVIYGVRASRQDPIRYSFAHGGKDGHPFPVAREDYDHNLEVLERALRRARLGQRESLAALRRLAHWQKAGPEASGEEEGQARGGAVL
ncbi:MAG: DUF763 domain-containing protein [Firmicutes bacterium]|nr:DUF763 domain-containing protein [Alicyclobacillaceae bacterium]MCL6497165.1 DUF763 domain-containing protein [Bacillota bacterium]